MSALHQRIVQRAAMAARNEERHTDLFIKAEARGAAAAYRTAADDVSSMPPCRHEILELTPGQFGPPFSVRCVDCRMWVQIRGPETRDVHSRTLREQVMHFHQLAKQPVERIAAVPSAARVDLRLYLIAEEFCELLESAGCEVGDVQAIVAYAVARRKKEAVNLPELVDAFGDLDFVVEGSRLEFGIDGKPIADAIYASNIAKFPTTMDANGKIQKPAGWRSPDIEGELRKQGWSGT